MVALLVLAAGDNDDCGEDVEFDDDHGGEDLEFDNDEKALVHKQKPQTERGSPNCPHWVKKKTIKFTTLVF